MSLEELEKEYKQVQLEVNNLIEKSRLIVELADKIQRMMDLQSKIAQEQAKKEEKKE